MTGIPSGLGAQWCFFDEVTYGVSPSLSTAKFYAVDSDGVKLVKVTKQGTGLFQGSLAPRATRRVVEQYSAAGPIVMDLPERNMQQHLFRMMGSYGQTASALTQDGATGAYSATHALGPLAGHSFAMQAGRPAVDGTVVPFTYTGCKFSEWEIACALGDIVKFSATIEGRNELAISNVSPHTDSLNASVPSLQAYTAPTSGSVFRWVGGALLYGGTASTTSGVTSISAPTIAANITGPLSLKVTRPLDLNRFAPDVAPYRNEPLDNGLVQIAGSFGVEWLSAGTYLSAHQADTATAIQLKFTTVPIGSGSDVATFSIMVPNVRLDDAPVPIQGPQVLTQTIPFTGLDDGANNIAQITYWTLDTA